MEIITGYAGTPHVTAAQDSSLNRAIFGLPTCILADPILESLDPQIQSNNIIRIRSAIGMIQGRVWWVAPNTYDEVNFNNGTQGENRIDLVTARYEKNAETGVESVEWNVIQGTPTEGSAVAPTPTDGNIDDGDNIADMKIFEVAFEGINLVSVTPVYNTALTLEAARISDATVEKYEALGFTAAEYSGGGQ